MQNPYPKSFRLRSAIRIARIADQTYLELIPIPFRRMSWPYRRTLKNLMIHDIHDELIDIHELEFVAEEPPGRLRDPAGRDVYRARLQDENP